MKLQLVMICAAVMLTCILGFAYGDEIIYSQDFDKLKDGDLVGQDGWDLITALEAGMGSLTVQSKVAIKGKAAQVDALQEVYKTYPKPVEAGICYLSIFFRKEDKSTDNTIHIYMGQGALAWSAGPVIRIGNDSGGQPDDIGIHDGSDAVRVQPAKFVVGKWHHVREVMDVDKRTFDVYLDGKKLGNYKFRNEAHKFIEWLMIGFDGGVGTLGYYDFIEFGTGTGEGAYNRATPVESKGKLSTTWGELKQ
jgi:hypothetical protein